MIEYIVREIDCGLATRQEIVGELVRCKDCKNRNRYECDHIRLGETKCGVTDDWFCADGKRREDGGRGMRVIDADELLKNYQTICSSIRCYDCQFNGEWGDKGCQLAALIEDAPTLELIGHWVGIDDEPCETFECDRCGYILETTGELYNYCPNCGANMGEDEE